MSTLAWVGIGIVVWFIVILIAFAWQRRRRYRRPLEYVVGPGNIRKEAEVVEAQRERRLKLGDSRVQPDFGGTLRSTDPDEGTPHPLGDPHFDPPNDGWKPSDVGGGIRGND